MPEGVGEVNAKGLDFYDKLVDTLLEADIDPYVTLYHWDLPSALQRMGGWAARDTAYRFVDYVGIVADRLSDRVKNWITHNEPWVVAFLGNMIGGHAPGWQDPALALQVAHHVLLSHGLAVPVLREKGTADTRVGITLNFSPAYPASNSEQDLLAARLHDGMSNRWFTDPIFKGYYPEDMWDLFGYMAPRVAPGDLEIISRPVDFLGVNYYTRALVEYDADSPLQVRQLHPEGEYTAMDWEVFPPGPDRPAGAAGPRL
jgi:beta-glucosidase